MRKKGFLLAIICIAATVANLTTYAKETPGTPTPCHRFETPSALRSPGFPIRGQAASFIETPLVSVPSATFICGDSPSEVIVICLSSDGKSDFTSCLTYTGPLVAEVSTSPDATPDAICGLLTLPGMRRNGIVRGWYDSC